MQAVLLPLFVQVALTFVLLVALGRRRVRLVRTGAVHPRDVALGQPGWPPAIIQLGNCLNNQFQLPVLFYVATVLALITRKADLVFVVLAWLFVATRFIHAAIHVTSNRLALRFYAYLTGTLVLMAMWAWFAASILLSPLPLP